MAISLGGPVFKEACPTVPWIRNVLAGCLEYWVCSNVSYLWTFHPFYLKMAFGAENHLMHTALNYLVKRGRFPSWSHLCRNTIIYLVIPHILTFEDGSKLVPWKYFGYAILLNYENTFRHFTDHVLSGINGGRMYSKSQISLLASQRLHNHVTLWPHSWQTVGDGRPWEKSWVSTPLATLNVFSF